MRGDLSGFYVEEFLVSACANPDCYTGTGPRVYGGVDDARDEYVLAGWVQREDGLWVCPKCLASTMQAQRRFRRRRRRINASQTLAAAKGERE